MINQNRFKNLLVELTKIDSLSRKERNIDSTIVQLVQRAAKNLRLELKTHVTGGGCDANVLNQKGLEVANLSTGMREIHTVNERLDFKDLYLSAEVVREVVRLNGASH